MKTCAVCEKPCSDSRNVTCSWPCRQQRLKQQQAAQLLDRFWSKVSLGGPDECWLWARATNGKYGKVYVEGKLVYAHRFAYTTVHGEIPEGYHVDHVWERGCRSPLCCNPRHLEAVTPKVNSQRKTAKKTRCPNNHLYDEANTYMQPHRGGYLGRVCRACRRNQQRARRASLR